MRKCKGNAKKILKQAVMRKYFLYLFLEIISGNNSVLENWK